MITSLLQFKRQWQWSTFCYSCHCHISDTSNTLGVLVKNHTTVQSSGDKSTNPLHKPMDCKAIWQTLIYLLILIPVYNIVKFLYTRTIGFLEAHVAFLRLECCLLQTQRLALYRGRSLTHRPWNFTSTVAYGNDMKLYKFGLAISIRPKLQCHVMQFELTIWELNKSTNLIAGQSLLFNSDKSTNPLHKPLG